MDEVNAGLEKFKQSFTEKKRKKLDFYNKKSDNYVAFLNIKLYL